MVPFSAYHLFLYYSIMLQCFFFLWTWKPTWSWASLGRYFCNVHFIILQTVGVWGALCSPSTCRSFWLGSLLSGHLQGITNKGKGKSLLISSCLLWLSIKELKWQFKQGFTMVEVTTARRLRLVTKSTLTKYITIHTASLFLHFCFSEPYIWNGLKLRYLL